VEGNNTSDESENNVSPEEHANKALAMFRGSVLQPQDQLKLLFRAVESTRNGIVVTDPTQPDNPIIYANPAFAELCGFRIDQIIGRNCRFLQRDDRDQSALDEIRNAINNQRPITTVVRNYKKDGTLFWNELTISPVHDSSGKLINYIGVQNDVSARKDAERRVSEFYSVISHELRTPLTSITGALSSMEDGSAGKLNARATKLIKIGLVNCTRLMNLINEILDWKKIEAGKFKLKKRLVEPTVLIDSVLDDLSLIAEQSSVKLVKDICSEEAITADPDRLAQVLANLTANAIKFSPANGRVFLRVEKQSRDTTRFTVRDEGPGIPKEQQSKLFVNFQQLDSSDTRTKGGTGLGLAISKAIIELHGGHIGVLSQPGEGASFWFEIFG
jgi:PAS domain S-box-containing protein